MRLNAESFNKHCCNVLTFFNTSISKIITNDLDSLEENYNKKTPIQRHA